LFSNTISVIVQCSRSAVRLKRWWHYTLWDPYHICYDKYSAWKMRWMLCNISSSVFAKVNT